MSGTIRIPMSAFYDYGRDKVAADHKFRDGWDRIFGKKEGPSQEEMESFFDGDTFGGDCD